MICWRQSAHGGGWPATICGVVIEAVVAAQQGGQITAEEAAEIIKALLAVAMSGQVNALVNDFFTPDVYGRLGGHLGNRGFGLQGSRRFSLL